MTRRQYDYDLIILGGGAAGIVAGVVAGATGLRTLLIERNKLGGECSHTGCVPSKALLYAAGVAHRMRTADRVGLQAAQVPRTAGAEVLRHVRAMIPAVAEADGSEDLLRANGTEIRYGVPLFESPDAIQFTPRAGSPDAIRFAPRAGSPDAIQVAPRNGSTVRLTAEHFLLATGSRPARPDIAGLEEAGYRTNTELFELEEIPESLLVLGGGPVGVEMAQAFARLGSAVTLVEQGPRILPRDDAEAAEALRAALCAEGIDVRVGTRMVAVRDADGRKVVRVVADEREDDIAVAEILVAAGRRPNVEGLNLEAAGVACGANGVVVSPTLHTTSPRVWACGDVIGREPFSHMAEYEARLVVRNILFPLDRLAEPGFQLAPWVTYTDPEVAHVGLTEEQARERGIAYEVYRQPFAQNDRALLEDAGTGFVKVLAGGLQGTILGAHIVGPRAGELLQEWIHTMTHGQTLRQVADTIHAYPTLSTANAHAAARWYEAQAKRPAVDRAMKTYTRTVRPNLGRLLWTAAGAAALAGGALLTRGRNTKARKR